MTIWCLSVVRYSFFLGASSRDAKIDRDNLQKQPADLSNVLNLDSSLVLRPRVKQIGSGSTETHIWQQRQNNTEREREIEGKKWTWNIALSVEVSLLCRIRSVMPMCPAFDDEEKRLAFDFSLSSRPPTKEEGHEKERMRVTGVLSDRD